MDGCLTGGRIARCGRIATEQDKPWGQWAQAEKWILPMRAYGVNTMWIQRNYAHARMNSNKIIGGVGEVLGKLGGRI